MWTEKQWSKLTEESFVKWVEKQPVQWTVVTFKARKIPIKYKRSDVEKINSGLISRDSVGNECNSKEFETALTKTLQHLDFKYLKTSLRKRGVKLKRVLFHGGDKDSGIWYHVHALVELPSAESVEKFSDYMNKIFASTMKVACGVTKNRIIDASVWCRAYVPDKNKFLKYALRPEGETLAVSLDKVIFPLLEMSPAIN